MAIEVSGRRQPTATIEEATRGLISTIDAELVDNVTYEPLTRARTLPCGHNFNEDAIRGIVADRNGNKPCPNCRAPFRAAAPNLAIRNVVNARLALQQATPTNPSVEAMAQLERAALSSPSMEATAHYEKGKRFAAQGNYEQAIQGCLAAITLSPDFAKAHAYLHFLLDQQGRVSSVPQPTVSFPETMPTRTPSQAPTRPVDVEVRPTAPRQNPPLATRVSRVAPEQEAPELGLTGALKQYVWSIYGLNKLIIESLYEVTGAGQACESAGEAIGTRIREIRQRG